MAQSKSRFQIDKKSKIRNMYVIFAENIHVSFKANRKKDPKNLGEQIWELEKSMENVSKKEIVSIKKQIEEVQESINTIQSTGRKEVLRGITFGLRQGETLALIGANGAGKTVLMETILGLIEMDEGEVYLNLGHETFQQNIIEIGIQYQQSKFSKGQKVEKLLDEYRDLYGRHRTTDEEFNEMIEAFDIRPFFTTKIDDLSGGQKQRLNLMLSIMHNPKVMILDEFITGLDVKSVRKIITYVNKLKIKNDASMIIISHQPEEIEQLADRILLLRNGKIIEETSVEEIKEGGDSIAIYIEDNI